MTTLDGQTLDSSFLTEASVKSFDLRNCPEIEGYECIRKIFQSGFATVWLFFDQNMGREVVVKRFEIPQGTQQRVSRVAPRSNYRLVL